MYFNYSNILLGTKVVTKSFNSFLPQVSYVKSLEWYLIMCFLFVFAAILEYAFVSYLVFRQREKERELLAEMQAQVIVGQDSLKNLKKQAKLAAIDYIYK